MEPFVRHRFDSATKEIIVTLFINVETLFPWNDQDDAYSRTRPPPPPPNLLGYNGYPGPDLLRLLTDCQLLEGKSSKDWVTLRARTEAA